MVKGGSQEGWPCGGWKLVLSGLTSAPPHTPLLAGIKEEQRNGMVCIQEMVVKDRR